MRITELIRLLEGVHRREGDLEVVRKAFCTVPMAVQPVQTVCVDKIVRKGGRRRFDEIDNSAANNSGEQIVHFQ